MQTYTGKHIDPLSVKPSDITLIDYARSLSMASRFNGHLERAYSVLNHCINMGQHFYDLGLFREAKYACFHEGDEMIFGDIITPVKYLDEFAAVRELMKDAQRAVYKHFKLYGTTPKIVKEIDEYMKIWEAKKVKPNSDLAAMPDPPVKVKIRVLSQRKCEEEFFALVDKIEQALGNQ